MIYDSSLEVTTGSLALKPTFYFVISLIDDGSFGEEKLNTKCSMRGSSKSSVSTRRQRENTYILGFRDIKKVNDIFNMILIDKGSSCDVMYTNIFMNVGLHN